MTPWLPITQGLWIGDGIRPFHGEFDHILAIMAGAPVREDHVRIRHLPPPAAEDQTPDFLDRAAAWILDRWSHGSTILVQAQPLSWAELVTAALFVQMGATADEAILSLRRVKPDALDQQPHLDLLRAREVRHG